MAGRDASSRLASLPPPNHPRDQLSVGIGVRLTGISGGGRAFGGSGNRLPRPQPPPNCSTDTVHLSFMFVPGIEISISRTLRRTHSARRDSFGTQYLSKVVGS